MTSTDSIILRKRLMKAAEHLDVCRIIYIQAPAGYGKSVFAGQWMDRRKAPGTMVTFDQYDNSLEEICHKLKAVPEDLCTGEEAMQIAVFTKHPDFCKAPAEFLMHAAVRMPKDTKGSIVLDDLHYMTDRKNQKVLKDFLLRLPDGIKICMLSRSALPEIFSDLALKDELKFIFQDQMLFDDQEICELYKSKGIELTKKEVKTILARTEGWPIGIRALLLSGDSIPGGIMPKDWLADFLENQVWELWSEERREFMTGICMEDELTEDLCNVLTGKDDSGVILKELCMEGAFLYAQRNGTYRFHKLFCDFLRKQFSERPEEFRRDKIRKSAIWHQEHLDFYQAVYRFSVIKDYEQIARCFDQLECIDRAGFDTAQVMRAVHEGLNEEIAERYPHLYFMMAFTARNEGRIDEFKNYADRYYRNYARIVERNPELAHNIFFLYAMDFRLSLQEISKRAAECGSSVVFRGVRGSATLYLPFYHRSFRDFSELLAWDLDTGVQTLEQTLGALLGEECPMLIDCIKAGLYYERGELLQAQELACSAVAKMHASFAPESKFCAWMLLWTVEHALGQMEQEGTVEREIKKMIEEDQALYLKTNLDAVIFRSRLSSQDTAAAAEWIALKGVDASGEPGFYDLYVQFTTARAYIAVGEWDRAVILLEKILYLCRSMKRPADMIDAEILLAIAFWKKRCRNQKMALFYLEEAVKAAQPFLYIQAFINEGTELENLLSILKNKTVRSDYNGEVSGAFVRKLYICVVEQNSRGKRCTDQNTVQTVKLTTQQKRVAALMCEGFSYRKIAEELGIRFSTVRSHIELIYRKLDVSNINDAILKIRSLHLLE